MERLNYHHLFYFWAVAREGSLSAASKKLNVSQPSISAQISALEEALGENLFRREGRGRALTEAGHLAMVYADEIFALGRELVSSVSGRGAGRILHLHVGVLDSFPKLLTNQFLKPVFTMPQPVHVICREGKLDDLLGQLITHRLDIVLADEPASGSLKVRTFNHRLGNSTLTICAAPGLAKTLRQEYPKSLDNAPALLPATNSSSGRSITRWFESIQVKPRVLAEFEDLALLEALAADGKGFIAVPTAILEEVCERYGFEAVGLAGNVREHFFAITAQRRIRHPAVEEITGRSQDSPGS
jgi:LysR family transcriptional activator of nhaA